MPWTQKQAVKSVFRVIMILVFESLIAVPLIAGPFHPLTGVNSGGPFAREDRNVLRSEPRDHNATKFSREGEIHFFGQNSQELNLEKAVTCFEQAWKYGEGLGTARLGEAYYFGMGVEKVDQEAGIELFKQAKEFGNPLGTVRYAEALYFGFGGLEKNPIEAENIIRNSKIPNLESYMTLPVYCLFNIHKAPELKSDIESHFRSLESPQAFDGQKQSLKPYVVGIAGGSASGKSTFAEEMTLLFSGENEIVILTQDSYYKSRFPSKIIDSESNINFDHPDAIDFKLLFSDLKALKDGKTIKSPVYDFETHSRLKTTKKIQSAKIIILEGIYALKDPKILDLIDLKLFINADAEVRLERRIVRDIAQRFRKRNAIEAQIRKHVIPMFLEFVKPTEDNAHFSIENGKLRPAFVFAIFISDYVKKVYITKTDPGRRFFLN